MLTYTEDTISDKRIASFEFKRYFLNGKCLNNEFIRERFMNLCKLFLENKYIEEDIKIKTKKILYKENNYFDF